MRTHENIKAAERRSRGWRTLALAFYEPTLEWVQALLEGTLAAELEASIDRPEVGREKFAASLELVGDFVEKGRQRDPEKLLKDIKIEHARLFVGPGAMLAPPYESVYRDRDPLSKKPIIMGPSTLAVQRTYHRHGLRLIPSHKDIPDHLATELEFMYFLCSNEQQAWETGDTEDAKELRRAQLKFLQEHLAVWLPSFCQQVQSSATCDLYQALAAILSEFVVAEMGTDYA